MLAVFKIFLLQGLLLLALPAFADDRPDPQQVVRDTVSQVLSTIEEKQTLLKQQPNQIFSLVGEIIDPRFDFAGMTRSAVGKHWRKANDEQREKLIVEFRQLLVGTYGTALLNYAGQSVEYSPLRLKDGAKKVVVRTKIIDKAAPPLAVNYSLRWKAERWQVYNIEIANIKLTINYRGTFDSVVKKSGISGLIESLVTKNEENRARHAAKDAPSVESVPSETEADKPEIEAVPTDVSK